MKSIMQGMKFVNGSIIYYEVSSVENQVGYLISLAFF